MKGTDTLLRERNKVRTRMTERERERERERGGGGGVREGKRREGETKRSICEGRW